jgi:ribosome biogenesis GTPase / thiamine phosphate phosphatase
LKRGLVIKSTGSRYRILYGKGITVDCTIKGRFRVKGMRTTNPVAVGDNVLLEINPKDNSGVITEILDRRNYIIRKASNLSKQSQIIAANIDHLFLMVTLKLPETPVEFIDRFLMTAEAYRIRASIIFNKTDLYGIKEIKKLQSLISVYSRIGYGCFSLSLKKDIKTDDLVTAMKDKINLLSGNSGVGKTSLLNYLNPSLNLKTESISDYHKQGKHITTFPEMHQMPFGGYIIDTPGIRGFGVIDIDRNEIYHFFPEIFRKSKECRFYNCLHLEEPDCAVRAAAESGEINLSRYRSYLNILEDENRKYR